MEKEKRVFDVPKLVLFLIEVFIFILAILFFYYSAKGRDYTGVYNQEVQQETVKSLIIALQLYNVHEIPFTNITPKMQLYIKENYSTNSYSFVSPYFVEIVNGDIVIKNGETSDSDIIITTTEDEVLRIASNSSYVYDSLASNRTIVQKSTSDFILFAKGYSTIFWKENISA
ncbi:MAG TPA: hypothetical protein VMC80_00875 [Patescibacteria group bacterium]|nr:hypothetical protein [Patescibacteria group bacterium]